MTNTTPLRSVLTIDAAFNGPARCGHGGVAGGFFASLVGAARASVRFDSPVPLDEPLATTSLGDTATIEGPDGSVAMVHALSEPLRPGPVPESALFATSWNPGIACDVPDWMVWAALDCPTGLPGLFRVGLEDAVVTAQLCVDIRDRVRGDGDYQLISRRTGGEGRKHHTEAALVDERGRSVAAATALWLTVPIQVMQPERGRVDCAA